MNRVLAVASFALIGLAGCNEPTNNATTTTAPVSTTATPATSAGAPNLQMQTILTGYQIIWGMDFLPNGDLLFTEKQGRVYRYTNNTATELTGFPADVNARGQGGLLDLRVHPNYASNGWVYAVYSSAPTGNGPTQLNLARFKVSGNQITDLSTIFKTSATNTWQGHYGGRIEFDRDGLLYLSVGEGGSGTYGGPNAPNQNGQNLNSDWGKIHRLTDSGGIPANNPILPGRTTPSTIFSYGHRNPQGMALNPTTGDIWATEHGPRGGDEVNIIQAGRNYGWPVVSNGLNYDGSVISSSPTRQGVQAPIFTWTPSMGPSGLAFLTSETFKGWKGDLMVGGLALTYLSRCDVRDNTITGEEKLLDRQGRVRCVRQGPDGNLYISLENPGRIIRIVPQ
ncbi:PQQ-dependent sugar dehydrogenase [Rudanella paleaurantiibacter]|uniref:PQQ-dependent sugar dehydrogenase n=1 Tax=Rudanella paleaurantiibacter TaxID=2614655 RepID=A0A7J5U2D9_9BACT|nr:PQQ-dependent sugar dehydrogenase [Rudanella paleaurantiibacter]KAB7731808.1 PQQ-dependent sugar dehydrogenase [Rudanella paleaurantiibacter]